MEESFHISASLPPSLPFSSLPAQKLDNWQPIGRGKKKKKQRRRREEEEEEVEKERVRWEGRGRRKGEKVAQPTLATDYLKLQTCLSSYMRSYRPVSMYVRLRSLF